jgi:4-amino-4-deoxy-L-arabinose transferase-like glycosyltransferase
MAAALVLAVAVRLLFAFGYWVGKPLNHDEQEYLELGRNLASGHGFSYDPIEAGQPEPERFGRAPLYPLRVAAVARVTAPAALIPALKVVQSLLGALTVWLIAVVARRTAGDSASLIAAWVAALYPPLAWLSAFVFSEALYVVLAIANVVVLGALVDGPRLGAADGATTSRRWRLVAVGVVGGLAALTRPAHVFFLVLVGLWLAGTRRLSWAVLIAAGALVVVAPWTVRNYVTYGRPVLIASEGGITFWTGNHPLSPGEGDMAANPAIKLDDQRIRASHPGLSAEQLEPVYYREALRTIAAHPWWWLRLEARKFFFLWVPIGPSYLLHSRLYLTTTWIAYGLVMPPGLVGLALLWRRGPRPRALVLLLLSAVVACLLFLPQERFRIPVIDPALIVGAAATGGLVLSGRRRPPSRASADGAVPVS